MHRRSCATARASCHRGGFSRRACTWAALHASLTLRVDGLNWSSACAAVLPHQLMFPTKTSSPAARLWQSDAVLNQILVLTFFEPPDIIANGFRDHCDQSLIKDDPLIRAADHKTSVGAILSGLELGRPRTEPTNYQLGFHQTCQLK